MMIGRRRVCYKDTYFNAMLDIQGLQNDLTNNLNFVLCKIFKICYVKFIYPCITSTVCIFYFFIFVIIQSRHFLYNF